MPELARPPFEDMTKPGLKNAPARGLEKFKGVVRPLVKNEAAEAKPTQAATETPPHQVESPPPYNWEIALYGLHHLQDMVRADFPQSETQPITADQMHQFLVDRNFINLVDHSKVLILLTQLKDGLFNGSNGDELLALASQLTNLIDQNPNFKEIVLGSQPDQLNELMTDLSQGNWDASTSSRHETQILETISLMERVIALVADVQSKRVAV